jgi:hypothetical protein
LQHLVAQLPEELDLKKGDEVIVTGEAEDGWLRGESQGKTGIFPSGFISFITEDSPRTSFSQEISAKPVVIIPATTSYPIQKVDDHLNRRPYGIASYDFRGQQSDELSFSVGQTVFLFRHVNAEWMEGEANGRKGIFPTLFVDIVVDCDGPSTHEQFDKSNNLLLDYNKSNNLLLDTAKKSNNLLFDFDPLVNGDNYSTLNISSNETNNRESNHSTATWGASAGSAHTSLDSLIARNLNLLGSTSSSQACEKQRPASWSQTLNKLQIEYSTQPERKLPPIPPRRQETESLSQTIHHHAPSLQPTIENLELEVVGNEPIIGMDNYANSEACGSISSGMSDSGASRRKSYTRPAPPPPADSPNLGLSRQDSSDSIGSHFHSGPQPLRPAPQIPCDSKWL